MKPSFSLATLLAALVSTPAIANESAYTSLDLAACSQRPTDPREELPWALWHCAGHGGIALLIGESDLRFTIAYGIGKPAVVGDSQTLPPFNRLGEVMEWRLDAAGQPFATIVRYFTDTGDPAVVNQVLVVTKLGAPSCQVAYVDALANADANGLARTAADLVAPNFRCNVDTPIWVSATGAAF